MASPVGEVTCRRCVTLLGTGFSWLRAQHALHRRHGAQCSMWLDASKASHPPTHHALPASSRRSSTTHPPSLPKEVRKARPSTAHAAASPCWWMEGRAAQGACACTTFPRPPHPHAAPPPPTIVPKNHGVRLGQAGPIVHATSQWLALSPDLVTSASDGTALIVWRECNNEEYFSITFKAGAMSIRLQACNLVLHHMRETVMWRHLAF